MEKLEVSQPQEPQPTMLVQNQCGTVSFSKELSSVDDINTTKHSKVDAPPHPPVKLPSRVKGPWSREEDELLAALVAEHGAKKWSVIAEKVPGRIGKQCRERWLNHLDRSVKKTPWTEAEDQLLLDAQKQKGNRWCEIARLLPGRPENAVKNRFNSLTNRGKISADGKVLKHPASIPPSVIDTRQSASTEVSDHVSQKPEPNFIGFQQFLSKSNLKIDFDLNHQRCQPDEDEHGFMSLLPPLPPPFSATNSHQIPIFMYPGNIQTNVSHDQALAEAQEALKAHRLPPKKAVSSRRGSYISVGSDHERSSTPYDDDIHGLFKKVKSEDLS